MAGDPLGFDTDRIRAQLRKWQERLIDLTKRNPLLGINRSRVTKLQVSDPSANVLFEQFVVGETVLQLPFIRPGTERVEPEGDGEQGRESAYVIDPGDLAFAGGPSELKRRIRRIHDNARTTVEERGVTTLHLAFGFLRWEDPALGASESPLWLVPCQLESFGPSAPLRLSRADEEMQVNPALELYLRERHQVVLPELPDEVGAQALGEFLQAVREDVRDRAWSVLEEVWLSTFSFESLVIYQDLKVLSDLALQNQIIAALARATALPEASEALGEELLDDLPTPEEVPVSALPTDSSQLKALTLAAGGRNEVIHGPPGTGKSQTISNLIVDALGRGKRVLFVSAKMAALEVVYNRLAQLGLGQFCLEAHSTKAGKTRVIEELKRTLEAAEAAEGATLDEELEGLVHVRKQLNTYVRELHEVREPLGRSVFQAIGRVAKLERAPEIKVPLPWENPLTVTRSVLGAALDALADLGAQADVFDSRESHPWRGFHPPQEARDLVETSLEALQAGAHKLCEALDGLKTVLGHNARFLSLAQVTELSQDLKTLSKVERLPPGWTTRLMDDLERAAALCESACALAEEFLSKKSEYGHALTLAFGEAVTLLTPAKQEFISWTRLVRRSYWRWRNSVRTRLIPGARADFHSLRSYLVLAERLFSLEGWFEEHRATLSEEIETANVIDPQALRDVRDAIRLSLSLRRAIARQNLDGPLNTVSLTDEVRRSAGAVAAGIGSREIGEAAAQVTLFWPGGFAEQSPVVEVPLPTLVARCEEILGARSKRHEWEVLRHTLWKCEGLGLARFVDALGTVTARAARTAFERRFYSGWTHAAIEQSLALPLFLGVRREQQIATFRSLDERIRAATVRKARSVGGDPARRVAGAQSGFGSGSEVATLRKELGKKRRIKPLRRLFAEIPHALQALKPCMLMSPLSVSTFLKPDGISFDLVVFDEASQLPTQEAIPSVLRAKQVVVAGDANQLPPTSFFSASAIFDDLESQDETGEELEPLESLLDDCVAIFPVFAQEHLRWHYRSRDERLIQFSNHYFYENRLITFPSSSPEADGRGVRLEYVRDGVYDRGRSRTNRREAATVAELVREQLERYPERSVGVVAMNVAQKEAIQEAVDALVLDRSDLGPLLDAHRFEPFFVKALEMVQGDERDTMIISVGYGKTADGALSYNFGPLNQEGGWRRLNVLVTRAKWQTILVVSLRSEELAGVNPNNRGAVTLRNFVAYAERGGRIPTPRPVVTEAETNDFEDAVAEALRERGFEIDQQVGVSAYRIDLAVRDPRDRTRYLLGVECDGATYHSAKTARDRDLLRQEVLRGLGWRLHRVWSTEWFHQRDRAMEGALRSIELAMNPDSRESVEASLPPVEDSEKISFPREHRENHDSVPSEAIPPSHTVMGGEPYRRYRETSGRRNRIVLLNFAYVQSLAEQIRDVVKTEGPIHEQLLIERLKEIHEVERAGSNIQGNIAHAIQLAVKRHDVQRSGEFLSWRLSELRTFRQPGDGVHRPLALLPTEELEFAILHVVEDQFGYQRDALPTPVARLFGWERARSDWGTRIGMIVDDLVERGRLRASGFQVYLS